MTIASTLHRADYVGAASPIAGPYSFAFKVFAATDLAVYTQDANGNVTLLSYATDYTVTGVGLDAGGTVTLSSALATGVKLAIVRAPAPLQTASIRNQGPYLASAVEDALDQLVMADQYQQDQLDRALKFPVTLNATGLSTAVAPWVAGNYLRVNLSGTGVETVSAVAASQAFLQSGSGAVSRSANAKMAETISVTDFGATGDGATDDTAAVQAALTAAAARSADVYFPPGRYVANGLSLAGSTPIRLRGAHRQSSVLVHKASSATDLLTLACPATIEHLGFDGNQPAQTTRKAALALNANLYPIEVRHCYFTRTANYAINLQQVNTQVTVTGCLFKNLSDWPSTGPTTDVSVGIYMSTAMPSLAGAIRIVDNDFYNSAPVANSPCGIQIAGYDYTSLLSIDILGNSFEYFGSNRGGTQPSGPIDLYEYFEKVTIIGNRVAYSACGGIKVGQAGTITITGNVLRDDQGTNATAAIFWSGGVRDAAHPSHNVVIADNVIRNWQGYAGVHVVGNTSPNYAKRVAITGNVIDNSQIGIFVDMGRDYLLADNVIGRCTGVAAEMAAIVLYRPQGMIVIRGGLLADNASYGILGDYFPNGGTIIIDGVACHDNTGSHLRLYDNANTLTLCEVRNVVTTGAATNILQNITRLDCLNNYFEAGAPGTTSVATYVHANNNFDVLTAVNSSPGFGLIANGASAIITTTVTGAAVGDFCLASLTTDAAGLTLTSYCSAPNTVRTIVANLTGGGVTPTGNVNVQVWKR